MRCRFFKLSCGSNDHVELAIFATRSWRWEPPLGRAIVGAPILYSILVGISPRFLSKHNPSITLTDQPTLKTPWSTRSNHHESRASSTLHSHQPTAGSQSRPHLSTSHNTREMTNPDTPTQIILSYLDGTRPSSWQSTTKWPFQTMPSSAQRKLWMRFLISSYMRYAPYWKMEPIAPNFSSTHTQPNTYVERQPSPNPSLPSSLSLSEYLKIENSSPHSAENGVRCYQLATDVQILRAFRSKEQLYIASNGGLYGEKGTYIASDGGLYGKKGTFG